MLYRKTVNAIITIAAAYLLGITYFVILFWMQSDYCFFAFLFPLFAYLWMITFGAKHVNNRYGFIKTAAGILIYDKKRKEYSALMAVHIVIFLFSSIARFISDIRNLKIIQQELIQRNERI